MIGRDQNLEKAWLLWRAGNVPGTEREARQVLADEPENSDALCLLALCQEARGDRETAQQTVEQAIAIDDENDFAWRILGHIHDTRDRNYKQAEEAFLKAVSLGPVDTYNHLSLANFYHRRSKHKEAAQAYELALTLDPENETALTDYASHHLEKGNTDQAMDLATRAARIAPDSKSLILLMGDLAFRQGNMREARDRALWILSQDAEDHQALVLLTKVKARKNPVMGIWLKWAMFMRRFSGKAQLGIILGLYVFYQISWRILRELGVSSQMLNIYIWAYILFCLMTWIAPYVFARMVQAETRTVHLDDKF